MSTGILISNLHLGHYLANIIKTIFYRQTHTAWNSNAFWNVMGSLPIKHLASHHIGQLTPSHSWIWIPFNKFNIATLKRYNTVLQGLFLNRVRFILAHGNRSVCVVWCGWCSALTLAVQPDDVAMARDLSQVVIWYVADCNYIRIS